MYFNCDHLICFVLIFGSSSHAFALSTSKVTTTTEVFPVATTEPTNVEIITKSRYEQGLEDYDEALANARQSRGMSDYAHDIYYAHDHPHPEEMKEEKKAVATDPWTSYYDFIINEWSYKFWAVFQLFTAALLIYSALAAAYYAKFNVITTDYDYYDDFFGRSNNESPTNSLWSGLSSTTFQRILDAISSKKYT